MGNDINKNQTILPKNFIIFFKEDNKDEISFKIELHKLILSSLPTPFFSEILICEDDNFTLTIPKVNAEVHILFCAEFTGPKVM